jgi:hypothetical protein
MIEAQHELASAAWPGGLDLVKVRMGVHTGSPTRPLPPGARAAVPDVLAALVSRYSP